ncbi:MAG: beta-N-acetylglucosaminidase domain-containing protein [Planctomycetota bacterium]|nr:beta-N-acetylglucosaminidase domain-containing protein [Planctomycetota bacterium]
MRLQTTSKHFAVAVLVGFLVSSLLAADNAGPSFKDRIAAAERQLKDKQYDAAEQSLLEIGKEAGLGDATKFFIYRKFMALYGAKPNDANMVEYARKILALPGADAKQKTEALNDLAASTDYNRQYGAYYLELRPKDEVARLEQDNRFSIEELVKLNPGNAACRIALGNLHVRDGAANKGAAEFKSALDLPGLTPMQQGDALTGLASAALLKGDRAGAIRYCEDLAARNLNTSGRYSPDPVAQAHYALRFMKGPELDYLKLPYHTGAKVFPTPQQAKYTEEFVPLTSVKLALGRDIKDDDVRLSLLKAKFGRFGITFADDAPFTIRINADAEPKAPEKPEGYALTVSKAGAAINSHDAQGTLWGIVSLIQLVDREQVPRVRIAEILDYPDVAHRGFLQGDWIDALEYMLFCKMNTVVSQTGPQVTNHDPGRPWTPLQKAICKGQSEAFTAFGLRMYYGITPWTMWYLLPLSSERTFELHFDICSEIARNSGHIYFPYDDCRFPLPQADLDKFGTAANVDAKYVTRLFQAVRKDHPGFHMVFCPPFYWGPDSRASYPEPREPYLKSLGDYLDPGIDVFWTGPRVKGYQKTREQAGWFTGLTKRKPMIFQNGTGPHNLLSYITDETPGWKTWHYEGFLENDIEAFLKNAHMGMEAPQTTTLADCLWNVKAYDAATSIRSGVALLYGKEMFDILDPANKALAYLDKYKYGEITPEVMAEIPEIERRLAIAEEAYKKGLAYNAFSLQNFPGALCRGVEFARTALKAAKSAPDFRKQYGKDIDATRAIAAKEVGIDLAGDDIFKSPLDLMGGTLMVYDNKCPKRFATVIRGRKTATSRLKLSFECDPFPPAGDYILHLSAQDDETDAQCQIRIAVNGKTVFEGPNKFARFGWSVETFILPFDSLKRGNELTIENIEDADNGNGPPWFMVNYAVIKKKAVQ